MIKQDNTTIERKIVMKNSIMIVFHYAIIVSLFAKGLSAMNQNSLEVIDFFNLIGLVIFMIFIIKSIIQPYVVIESDILTIYRDYFKKEVFSLQEIKGLEIAHTPFSSSFFILKGNRKVKINSYALKKSDVNILLKMFTIHRCS